MYIEEIPLAVLISNLAYCFISMQAQIQDYIKYFNQVVIVAMKEFLLTSSQLFQERVLFMLHQLLLLKVKFEPLDPQSVSVRW